MNVYADMSSMLFYKAMLLGTTEVSLDMGAQVRVAEMGYKTQVEDKVSEQERFCQLPDSGYSHIDYSANHASRDSNTCRYAQ